MAVHKNLPVNELHEAPQIAGATTLDAGKVITPSSTQNGSGELRQLDLSELTDVGGLLTNPPVQDIVTARHNDIGDATSTEYLYYPKAGTIKEVHMTIEGIASLDTVVSLAVGAAPAFVTLTALAAGSAGQVYSATGLSVAIDTDIVAITTDGATANQHFATFTFVIERT